MMQATIPPTPPYHHGYLTTAFDDSDLVPDICL